MGSVEHKGYTLIAEGTSGYIVYTLSRYGNPKPVDISFNQETVQISTSQLALIDVYRVLAVYN